MQVAEGATVSEDHTASSPGDGESQPDPSASPADPAYQDYDALLRQLLAEASAIPRQHRSAGATELAPQVSHWTVNLNTSAPERLWATWWKPSRSWPSLRFRAYPDPSDALKADQVEISEDFKVGILQAVAESNPEALIGVLESALREGLPSPDKRRAIRVLCQLVLATLDVTEDMKTDETSTTQQRLIRREGQRLASAQQAEREAARRLSRALAANRERARLDAHSRRVRKVTERLNQIRPQTDNEDK